MSLIRKSSENKIWHVATATHNSRFSQRMFKHRVKLREAVWLDEQDEIIITSTIAEIVKYNGLFVIEYNICGDHIHILLVCETKKLPNIVGKIKKEFLSDAKDAFQTEYTGDFDEVIDNPQ